MNLLEILKGELGIGGGVCVLDLGVPRRSTGGILVLIFQSWTYASYLVALKHLTKLLPHPVGIFFMGSVFGCIFLLLISTPQFVAIDWTEVPASGARTHQPYTLHPE